MVGAMTMFDRQRAFLDDLSFMRAFVCVCASSLVNKEWGSAGA